LPVEFIRKILKQGVQFLTEPQIELARVVSAPFDENTYVLWQKDRHDCVVVDPGFDTDQIFAVFEQHSIMPAAILNTHGHSDHIAGNFALKQRWPDVPLIIGQGDAPKLIDPELNLSADFGLPMTSPPADRTVRESDRFSAAGFNWEVREIPGHSAGHVVFAWLERVPHLVFVGDIIFRDSVGRSDFYDGDFDQLAAGIRAKLYTLPDDTVLLPGHGPQTTVGREKMGNPFVAEL
jgi:hydroxyacylglutathione hydrolase